MICDPEESGLDQKFDDYKKWLYEKDRGMNATKPKRLVINSNQAAS